MAPPGGGNGDASTDEPSEVAAAVDEYDEGLSSALESALAGRSGVVAVGVPLGLLPPVLAARRRTDDDEPWRIACRPGAVDALGRAVVLGTAVAEAVAAGEFELRTLADDAGRGGAADTETAGRPLAFATPDRVDAVAGPGSARTLVSETSGETASAAFGAAAARFDAATPATVGMPPRTRLLDAARETLDDRFADDVAAIFDALDHGAVGRTGTVTDRTLLVALAARHDHLFRDLRQWVDGGGNRGDGNEGDAADRGAEDRVASGEDRVAAGEDRVAVAPGQELTADRRALVERELIESIRVPTGPGRPLLRLRAVDEALLRAEPTEVLSVLRGRFALPLDGNGTPRSGAGGAGRRPVWDRK
ncbi:transcriptional regulator TbsP domain-containing protein [Halorubrum rutilum]|uniref:transcriptional regulator TbsP domain-containing protein n=1 Tax=Halorubrum rutilum TaxID=1364933 RepID=UPI0021121150|nr:DUF5821 family protein [Halorubrum rutilum]